MTDLCIQIQPGRVEPFDLKAVCECAETLAAEWPLITRFVAVSGDGYCNLMFETADPAALWAALSKALYDDPPYGLLLRRCTMVVCQGANGWDDYLLLQHFDEMQPLDRLI